MQPVTQIRTARRATGTYVVSVVLLALSVLICLPTVAESRKLPGPSYPTLDAILRNGNQPISQRVDRLIDVLPEYVARSKGDTRLLLPWFASVKSLLPPDDYIRIVQRLTDLEVDDARRVSLQGSISVLKIRAGSRQSRVSLYEEAISKGSVTTEDGVTIFGTDAMIWASDEGLESLEGLLRSKAAELEAISVSSAVMLARMEMRKFAVDLKDAKERELRGYCSMDNAQLAGWLSDRSKAKAFSTTLLSVCGDAGTGLCEAASEVVSRAKNLDAARVTSNGGPAIVQDDDVERALRLLQAKLMMGRGAGAQQSGSRGEGGCRALTGRSGNLPLS